MPAPAAPGSGRAWPNLDPEAVLARIEELRQDPDAFDYGWFGVSAAATFLRNVARAKPSEFNQFAKELFASGTAYLGARKVSPGVDVRNLPYHEWADVDPTAPPQADWMLMVALRDSDRYLTIEESYDAVQAMGIAAKEFAELYTSTGWYKDVKLLTDTSRAGMESLPAEVETDITIWLRTPANQVKSLTAVRMVALDTSLHFDDPQTGFVSFVYWDYKRTERSEQKISEFVPTYLGASVATLK
jgi:hypothetical protein